MNVGTYNVFNGAGETVFINMDSSKVPLSGDL